MANDWEVVKLKNAAQFFSGGTPPKSQPEYWGGDIPWISAKSMKGSRYHDSDLKLTEAGLKKGSRLAPKNSILLLVRGSMLHQKIPVGIATKDVAFNQDVKAIIPNEKFLPLYFYYCFAGRENEFLAKVENTGIGAGKLDTDVLNKIEFYCPPIAEQKSIAHILGSLDDKIELNRQMNDTLEAMAQALFKSWFVDFDPVIDNALAAGNAIPDEFAERAEQRKGIEKKDNSNIQDLFPDEFEFTEEMGWIPKGWRMSPLTEVIDFLEGPGIRNWQYTEEEDGIKFINIRCIQNGDIKLATANKITKEEAFGKYEHFQLEVDDIVVSASGTLGRYAFVRKEHLPLSLNTSVIRFRPIGGISTLYYIAGYIDTTLQFELETRATGSAQRNFGPMHLKQISMLLPPIDILDRHSELAKRLFNKRKLNLEQIETLSKLRDTLLPKLMSGELRISDAEALVDEV